MPDVDERGAEQRHQGDRKAHRLGRRPGLHVTVGGGVQHDDPEARDGADQQQQAPADRAELFRQVRPPGSQIGGEPRHFQPPACSRGRSALRDIVAHRDSPRGVAQLRLAQYVAADRRRHRGAAAAAGAAMLDHGGAHIARRAHRGEGDEERMVALLPRDFTVLAQAVLALVFGDAPDLRGAGLAAHREAGIGDARGIGGAALFVDHRVHAVHDQA